MKILSYRELQKRLAAHDARFQFYKGKGKGSHRGIAHPDIGGKRVAFTIPVHGEGRDIKTPYLSKLKRNFNLPADIFD